MNVSVSWLSEAALVMNCKVGSVPFVYLGLPNGGNARRLAFWEPLINRIKSRLSGWNSKHLSLGGCLVWCWRLLVDRESLWFRVMSGRYGGITLLPCVWRSGLEIMLVDLLETENMPFFGQISGLVVCRLEPGLADYLICRGLRGSPCLICVN